MSYKHEKESTERALNKLDSLLEYEGVQIEGEEEKEPEFELIPVKFIIENPVNIKWIIKGILESPGVNLLSGKYGSGKSFITFSMAFCVASGIDWHGHKCRELHVVVLAGEGHSGIGDRFHALSIHYGIECPDNLYISKVPAKLMDRTNASWVKKSVDNVCPGEGLVIIDTLNRNFGDGDENSTRDMTSFVASVDDHFRHSGKTVLIVHHTGHAEASRGRGSSVLPGSCEGEFIVTNNESVIEFSCKKQKNYKQSENISFELEEVDLNRIDDDGDSVVSMVVKRVYSESDSDETHEEVHSDLSEREQEFIDRLYTSIHQYGFPVQDIAVKGITYQSVNDHIARDIAYDLAGDVEQSTKRQIYGRLKKTLIKKGKLREINGCFSLIL